MNIQTFKQNFDYIKSNIYKGNGYNLETDPFLMNEIQRILDTNDIYYIDTLKQLIREEYTDLVRGYYRNCIKHTDNGYLYDCDEEIKIKEMNFWKMFKKIEQKVFVLLVKMKETDTNCAGVFDSLELARNTLINYDYKEIYIEEYNINSDSFTNTYLFN